LALLRARVVAGDADMRAATSQAMEAALAAPHDPAKVLADVVEMRARLAEVNASHDTEVWEVKLGRGRLLDIELMLQAGALLHGIIGKRAAPAMARALKRNGWLSAEDVSAIEAALTLFAAVQQIGRLAIDGRLDPARAGVGVMELLCRVTETDSPEALASRLAAVQAQMASLIDERLGTSSETETDHG